MARHAIPTGKMFSEEGAAAAWRLAAPGRAVYLAAPTARLVALAALGTGARVLVVGGGTGDEAIEAARAVGPRGEVTLTDLSPGMVEEAGKAVAEAGFPKIRCLAMDAQELDFSDASFDAVIGRNMLMFIPDLHRALSEIRRVLKPGGRFATTTWAAGNRNPRLAIPLAAAKSVGVKLPANTGLRLALSLSRPDRISAALKRAGFSAVSVDRVVARARPAEWDRFVSDLKEHVGTRSVASEVPPAKLDRFWRSFDRRFEGYRVMGEVPGEQLVIGGTA